MKIEINTGNSGDDTVVVVKTDEQTITLTVAKACELAISIATVAAQARRGNDYQEDIEA